MRGVLVPVVIVIVIVIVCMSMLVSRPGCTGMVQFMDAGIGSHRTTAVCTHQITSISLTIKSSPARISSRAESQTQRAGNC